ncbi:MAG: ACR3 family arsenite efflux transporter [Anaerolineae bacterium]
MKERAEVTLGPFERYIYVWIILCGAAGLLLGRFIPQVRQTFNAMTISGVSIPIAFLMFFIMMYPTMAGVRLEELSKAARNIKPTILTLIANWIITPPLMVLVAMLFLSHNPDYRAGIILLGLSPCTGMVLFWIAFARGNVTQGVVITAINALSTLILYSPFAAFYLGIGGVPVPFSLVLLSVILFIAIPLAAGQISRRALIKRKGETWFSDRFLPVMNNIAAVALLGMLVVMFSFEGQVILERPLDVVRIAIPLIAQFVILLAGVYSIGWLLGFNYEDAIMSTFIGSSTQFEVAIGTAMVVFGIGSGAALATVVGPLIEVPLMVTATKVIKRVIKRTRATFPKPVFQWRNL